MSDIRRFVLLFLATLCLPVAGWAANGIASSAAPVATLTAAQIADRHIAARGGLQAWHGVQTMSWSGKLEVGFADSVARSQRYVSNAIPRGPKVEQMALKSAQKNTESQKQVELPFLLEMKRPEKSRIEIEFAGKTAVQVFDGKAGWMKRPYLNRDDWEPFSQEQTRASAGKWDLDGPLLDYASKGTTVTLDGIEPVEGRDAYKLKLTMKGGDVRHVWIDSHSFLDVKVEGTPRRMDGRMRSVWVTQRDFRTVQGVTVPFVLETAVDGYPDTHKMTIDKVDLNPVLGDALFVRPGS